MYSNIKYDVYYCVITTKYYAIKYIIYHNVNTKKYNLFVSWKQLSVATTKNSGGARSYSSPHLYQSKLKNVKPSAPQPLLAASYEEYIISS